MPDRDPLTALHAQVSDRLPVRWDLVDLETLEARDTSELDVLRLLDDVAAAYDRFDAEAAGLDPPQPPPAAPTSTSEDEPLLTVWGRYRLDERIGAGGFGTVYRAWDPSLEMPVAIKILHRRLTSAGLREQLLYEGRLLAKVQHPHVVRVLNVEAHEGRLGLVLEFIAGSTLDAVVQQQGGLTHFEATLVAQDVCRALVAVHGQGLVHRDVKARNIMRERGGRIVLMDFGITLLAAAGAERGMPTAGTPAYMAPELLLGQEASARSDVYSVGVLLFHMVTGRYPPAGGPGAQVPAGGVGTALLHIVPGLPERFVAVVARALEPTPDARYGSAAEMLRALLRLGGEQTTRTDRLLRVAGAATGGLAVIFLGGVLSSAAFNQTLGRGAAANESVLYWLALGARSTVLPIVLALLSAATIGVLGALRHLLVSAWRQVRRSASDARTRWQAAAQGLGLRDPSTTACWLLLLTGLGLCAVWAHWWPLLTAVVSDAGTAPGSVLAVLSPAAVVYQANYRVALSLLLAGNAAGWVWLRRSSAARRAELSGWALPGEIALLVLLFLSMQVPYRIVYDSDEFPVVLWRDEKCYVLGTQDAKSLLFCPALTPRHHVPEDEKEPGDKDPVPFGKPESIFTDFSSQWRGTRAEN